MRFMMGRRLRLAHRRRYSQFNFITWKLMTKGSQLPHFAAHSEVVPISISPPLLQAMKYEIPVVLVILTLKYQGKAESIFEESPAALWCFVAATSSYWLTVGAIKEMTTTNLRRRGWIQILHRAALASALFSAISLLCICLPYPLPLWPLVIVMISPVLYTFSLLIEWVVEKMPVFAGARAPSDVDASTVEVCSQV